MGAARKELHSKVSPEGMRIGYLYDNASKEDKTAIDAIIVKYHDSFPLMYVGSRKMEMITDIKEAQKTHALFERAIAERKQK